MVIWSVCTQENVLTGHGILEQRFVRYMHHRVLSLNVEIQSPNTSWVIHFCRSFGDSGNFLSSFFVWCSLLHYVWDDISFNFFSADSVWHSSLASQEELQEVIQLLSCRPGVSHSTQLYHPSQHLPGEFFTLCCCCWWFWLHFIGLTMNSQES